MSAPWWLGIPPAEARLSCGGREHRLRWAGGKLLALDHPDLEGELILSVLGDQSYPCLAAVDAWAAHADDLRVLVLASRGLTDPVAPQPETTPGGQPASRGIMRARRTATSRSIMSARGGTASRRGPGGRSGGTGRGGAVRGGGIAGGEEEAEALVALLGLGGPMQARLVATVAAAWRERRHDHDHAAAVHRARPALHAALYGRVTAALRAWTGQPDLQVGLTMIPETQRPTLTSGADGILAELPFGWIVDVWGQGLSIFWGRFCLAAAPAEAGWVLSTVGPDLGPPQPITVGNPPAG